MFRIPEKVKSDARLGLKMISFGFKGGTETGWKRATQLARSKSIDAASLAAMRSWFARHGPDAANGGTSYPGYCKWIQDGSPLSKGFSQYRGAVAWLIWGGDAAYRWLKTKRIREALEAMYPDRKRSSITNNLKRRSS